MSEREPDLLSPPVAKRDPKVRRLHGDEVVDEYAWLVDRDDPDTTAYLEAENAYTEAVTRGLSDLRERLFQEIKARVQETDLSVPSRKGPWWYYGRTIEGQQYGLFCRRPVRSDGSGGDLDEASVAADPGATADAGDDQEQVLIDSNELAGSSPYFALGAGDVSPDHRLLAYSTDYEGDETYTMRFKDLDTREMRADEIPGTYYGTAWSADSSVLFYVTLNDAKRPHRMWRHRMGTPAEDDELLHEETDERFFCSVHLTRSERFVVLSVGSTVTSEVWVLPADDPLGQFRVVEPRRQGVEYSVDHWEDRFLVLTNDEAENFRLMEAPVDAAGRDNWRDVIGHRDDTRLDHVDAFAGHLVVHFRREGLTGLRVVPMKGAAGAAPDSTDAHEIEFPEPVFTVGPGDNPEYDTRTFRLNYASLVTPASVYDYDVERRELTLRKRQPVLGGYDTGRYESIREWAPADDGTMIPISILRLRETAQDGSAPLLLYGYGSYEISIDPGFRVTRLPLVDRGFVYAIAHIRGGGEMGRRWYESGKLLEKRNTFTDFVAAARHLVKSGYAAADRVAIRGGSAGGLLMGAVANLAPDDVRVVVAEVPFVDALNTICDPSLPLTVTEWEEWGNPLDNADVYHYMRSYSPYENVEAKAYPAILATAGLNDPRVGYHEPAKWVARLRATAGGGDRASVRPILLKTEMGAGHGGPSGRYDAWKDEAFVLAFVIDELGAPVEPIVPLVIDDQESSR